MDNLLTAAAAAAAAALLCSTIMALNKPVGGYITYHL